jgi:hypothetical protein
MRRFITYTLSKYKDNVQAKEDEMGRAWWNSTNRASFGKCEGKRPLG